MTFISTVEAGMTMAFPDVCKTPVPPGAQVPLPYPNMGMMANVSGASTKVKAFGAAVVTKDCKIPMSQGDDAGVSGGVVSGGFKKECKFIGSATKVFVGNKQVVRLNDPHSANAGNANGNILQPSQVLVTAS